MSVIARDAAAARPRPATAGDASPAPVLRVDHLSMRFGGLVAVNDLSFVARRGDITALIGPNGAGKTTVFNCITGFYKPTEGRIALQFGDDSVWDELAGLTDRGTRSIARGSGVLFLLERMPDHLVTRKARVTRTFQNIRLFQGMTVLENLLVAQHNQLMRASGFTVLGALGLPSYARAERAAIDRARYWLDRIALTARADDPAGELPYGAQRRLEIARAMCTEPVLLCLDEPAAGLNPSESAELRMRIWNSDGGEVESCGNAARCVVQLTGARTIDSDGGLIEGKDLGADVEVSIGEPRFGWNDIPLAHAMDTAALPMAWDGLEHPWRRLPAGAQGRRWRLPTGRSPSSTSTCSVSPSRCTSSVTFSPGSRSAIAADRSSATVISVPSTLITTSPPGFTRVAWKRTARPPPLMPASSAGPFGVTSWTQAPSSTSRSKRSTSCW